MQGSSRPRFVVLLDRVEFARLPHPFAFTRMYFFSITGEAVFMKITDRFHYPTETFAPPVVKVSHRHFSLHISTFTRQPHLMPASRCLRLLSVSLIALWLVLLSSGCVNAPAPSSTASPGTNAPTMAQILASTQPADWQPLDPEHTLYLELGTGRVVIQLAPAFAPRHVANVKALAREHYFDGLAIVRVQDNYVVQWGDPNA